jgi:hypothetical protein
MLPLIIKRLPWTTTAEKFRLWDLCDAHLGNIYADERRLEALVSVIAADPNAYWIAGGDKAEYINIDDRRFNPLTVARWVQVHDLGNLAERQAQRFLTLTRPIKDRCLLSIDGNHERTIYKEYHQDVGALVANGLGVPYCRDGAWLRLVFVQSNSHASSFEIVVHHGWGGGRSEGTTVLKQALETFAADLVLLEHVHKRKRHAVMSYAAGRDEVKIRKRLALFCGCYLPTSDYALERGYQPSEVDSVMVELTPATKNITVRL